ncbi:MAG: DUF1844 domain-containing protein [Lentisphaerae bacterium]|nr:DUF1844 domain-containing protein [Lentisphaerota bacterium]
MNEAKPDTNKILFMHLLSMLAMSVMQQLGKLVNPATGKAEIHLEAAQATIDTLDMLSAKTKNNLEADEEKLLKDTLASLKLNFVETKDARERQERAARNKPPESKPSAEDQAPEKAEPQSGQEPPKDPKFHKSYS